MALRRSSQMLILGLAVFVIGAGVVLVSLMGSGDTESSAPPTTSTTLQAGTVVVQGATAGAAPTTFKIPEGKQAVAVQLSHVPGIAGYAKAGDFVNVYGNVEAGKTTTPAPPATKLILTGVEVLAVTGPAPGTPEGGNATYLLAVDAAQAEQAIFFARFESLWLTLVPKDQPKPPATPGRTYSNAF